MKKALIVFFSTAIIFVGLTTWYYQTHNYFPAPKIADFEEKVLGKSYNRASNGLRHITLFGGPFKRGFDFGQLTKESLKKQELVMEELLHQFFPNSIALSAFKVVASIWLYGIDELIDDEFVREMYGVSKWGYHKLDYLSDSLTRQVSYHLLHEIGQMFVDYNKQDMGCSVFSIKNGSQFIIGRNFDFDAHEIFEKEKLLKWVFPDQGIPFVSVSWPGMVGSVTGVNKAGIYASINAAGSSDFGRIGTPTTLLLTKVLQRAPSIEAAIKTIEAAQTFITDIFVIADRKNGRVVAIEKSPSRFSVRELGSDQVVTNHLLTSIFQDDQTNSDRQTNLTTLKRYNRGLELLGLGKPFHIKTIASFLRDKKLVGNRQTYLGHKASINPLIASHSVIYQSASDTLFVNEGPNTAGKYFGYNLKASFENKRPILTSFIEKDMELSAQKIENVKRAVVLADEGISLVKTDCPMAGERLKLSKQKYPEHENVKLLEALVEKYCKKNLQKSSQLFKELIRSNPAYHNQSKRYQNEIN